jgi:hypothetical protein
MQSRDHRLLGWSGKAVLLLMAVATLAACGGDGENGNFKPPGGTTVDVSGVVSAADILLEDTDVAAFIAGSPDTPEAMAMTNALGEYIVSVLEDTPTSLSFGAASFATFSTIYRSFGTNTTGVDIDLITTAVAQLHIDNAFPGMGFTLGDKAWLAISFDAGGNETGGVTVTTDAVVDGGGALDCDGLFTGSDTTEACDPPRSGPMYLAYFDANDEIAITAEGNAVSFSASAPVRVGEITILSISP